MVTRCNGNVEHHTWLHPSPFPESFPASAYRIPDDVEGPAFDTGYISSVYAAGRDRCLDCVTMVWSTLDDDQQAAMALYLTVCVATEIKRCRNFDWTMFGPSVRSINTFWDQRYDAVHRSPVMASPFGLLLATVTDRRMHEQIWVTVMAMTEQARLDSCLAGLRVADSLGEVDWQPHET